MRSRLRLLIVAAAGAIAAVGMGMGLSHLDALTSAQGTRQDSNGWIYYHPDPLINSHTVLQQLPKASDGTCVQRYTWSGPTLHPGDLPLTREEVAYNPTTCQVKYEQGTP